MNTKNNSKDIEIIKSLVIVSLIIGFLILGYYYIKLENRFGTEIIEKEIIKEEAIVDAQIFQWGENIDDSSEMFFDYWIYNYGNKEVKNVKVRCKLFDERNNLKVSVVSSLGNIASNSIELDEIITENFYSKLDEKFSAICYIESCDDCKILYKEIPEVVESYESE